MRRALLLILATTSAACGRKPGHLQLRIDTDLSLPKDIDTIAIAIDNRGANKHRASHVGLGSASAPFFLTSTLTLRGSERLDDSVHIRLVGLSGGELGEPRIVREAMTTVPADRVVTMSLKLSYLCGGRIEGGAGDAKSSCAAGQTCIAGACADMAVGENALADIENGSRSCFDVATCFDDAIAVELASDCSFAPSSAPSDVNVALRTEASGICSMRGCFVPLDAESNEGWATRSDSRVQLPRAVCEERIPKRDTLGVVVVPVRPACPRKTSALPTCGSWFDGSPAVGGPRVLADGQRGPIALAVGQERVYWGNAGNVREGKSAPLIGGWTKTRTFDLAPRDLAFARDKAAEVVFWATSDDGSKCQIVSSDPQVDAVKPEPSDATAPCKGVGPIDSTRFAYTTYAPHGEIRHVTRPASSNSVLDDDAPFATRIVADPLSVYWIREDGAIVTQRLGMKTGKGTTVKDQQDHPTDLALAFSNDKSMATTALFWSNSAAKGSIMRGRVVGSPDDPLAVEELVGGLSYPHGVAVFGPNVYWTNRGDGTIMRLRTDAAVGTTPETVASGQKAPTRIAVGATGVMWIAESDAKDGGRIVLLPSSP